METVLDLGAAKVFYDGILAEPRLDHPEGPAVHRDGSVWCGGERGQIYRIERDGSSMEQLAQAEDGFSQGMAFDKEDNLFVCDLKHAAVMKLDAKSGSLESFADGADGREINICNYPAFDAAGSLYVSDSHAFKEPGPGIFRFSSEGSGELWYDEPVNFANGLALSPDGGHLYVAETFGHAIFRIPIEEEEEEEEEEDGSAGAREEVAHLPGVLPDGLAFDTAGNLYVACYEPSQVLRVALDGTVERLMWDEEAHLLCHPTNLAFRDDVLFTTSFASVADQLVEGWSELAHRSLLRSRRLGTGLRRLDQAVAADMLWHRMADPSIISSPCFTS